jgi:Tol biopolymer transport system component
VAIKVLPELFVDDAERLVRFEREAKLLASLNHPGIAAVHGLHEDRGVRFLAMELVPGEDLAKRLSRGRLPVEDSLSVGLQIAEALEAAHAQGVIHRDLKPANVILKPDGKSKVLDFGLAKAFEPDAASLTASPSLSPTLTSAGTVAGVLLGTAAYMSPEQARGKQVDKRTDIWAFGCVLYECLAGQSVFKGESVTDSLGAILHKEPDWSLLPAGIPPTVQLLLRRCLTKDPGKRLHDIADARVELQAAIADPSASLSLTGIPQTAVSAAPTSRFASPWVLAGLAVVCAAVGLIVGLALRGGTTAQPVRKFDLGVTLERNVQEIPEAVISPDGSKVAYMHQDKLWIQVLDELEPRALEDTEGAIGPFWSPDGTELGYFAAGKLWKMAALGGRPVAICDVGGNIAGGRGAWWGDDGQIIYSRGDTGVMVVSALGGEPRELMPTEEGEGDVHEPHLLPDDAGILFISHPEDGLPNKLVLFHGGERRTLLEVEDRRLWSPTYAPSGHILFRRVGGDATEGLWAVPFSLGDRSLTGDPFIVVPDASQASVSRDGTLAFVHRPPLGGREHIVWVDRTGQRLEEVGGIRRGAFGMALSPDGRRMVFSMTEEEDNQVDLWVRDLERGSETRLTFDDAFEFRPRWTPSGDEILFGQFYTGKVVSKIVASDGSGPSVSGRYFVTVRAPEGETLSQTSPADIWLVDRSGAEEPRPLVQSPNRDITPIVSPDGRYLAYVSDRSGHFEVYLTRFPTASGRWKLSLDGGEDPYWDPRGDRLYFFEGFSLMEVSFVSGDEPRLGTPVKLFDVSASLGARRGLGLSSDGQRFAIVEPVRDDDEETTRSGIKVVQNWSAEFQR